MSAFDINSDSLAARLIRFFAKLASGSLLASLLAAVGVIGQTAIAPESANAGEVYRSATYNYSSAVQNWTPPSNATRVRFIVVGGGGGYGGLDCGWGCSRVPPSNAGYLVTDWIPAPTAVSMAVGQAGGGGADCATLKLASGNAFGIRKAFPR